MTGTALAAGFGWEVVTGFDRAGGADLMGAAAGSEPAGLTDWMRAPEERSMRIVSRSRL
ncbi:hypothetical protein N9A81_01915 [Synechococcus sp. AH-707-M23]|nr:hypothetical protein [Synechococcus sp. AH-707-M23]